jgi:aminomethyltransferase
MVDFAGWEMPVYYTGIIEEHLHTRDAAGLFDICHMGEFFIEGKDASREVERLVSCRIDDMSEGKCRYGFLLSREGGIMDDLIVFKISRNEFMLVVNAGTIEKDSSWISGNIKGDVSFFDRSGSTAKIDVQGPSAPSVMGRFAGKEVIENIGRYSFLNVRIGSADVLLARTGYTGEIGYELFFNEEHASRMWDSLMCFDEIKPVGLGARDTLRLEMGYPLYGSDICEEVDPFEAGLGRFVYMDKDFIGKEALLARNKKENEKILMGFECDGRRIARHGFKVETEGVEAGVVTSGGFSPCLKKAIGLCYIDKKAAHEGGKIILTDGKISIEAKLAKTPLLKNK